MVSSVATQYQPHCVLTNHIRSYHIYPAITVLKKHPYLLCTKSDNFHMTELVYIPDILKMLMCWLGYAFLFYQMYFFLLSEQALLSFYQILFLYSVYSLKPIPFLLSQRCSATASGVVTVPATRMACALCPSSSRAVRWWHRGAGVYWKQTSSLKTGRSSAPLPRRRTPVLSLSAATETCVTKTSTQKTTQRHVSVWYVSGLYHLSHACHVLNWLLAHRQLPNVQCICVDLKGGSHNMKMLPIILPYTFLIISDVQNMFWG